MLKRKTVITGIIVSMIFVVVFLVFFNNNKSDIISENSNPSPVDPNTPQVVIEEEGILRIKNTQEYKTLIDEYGEDVVSVKAVNLLDVKDTLFLKEIDNDFKQSPGCIILLEYKNDEGYIYQLDKELNIVHQMSFLKFTELSKNVDSDIMDGFYNSLK